MRRLFLNRSEPAKKSGQNIPKNRCRTTIAEQMVETRAELPFIGDQVVCLSHEPGRPQRNAIPNWDKLGRRCPNAGYEPHPSCCDCPLTGSEPAKKSGQNIPKNRCRTTIAEADSGNASGTALYRGSGRLLKPRPGRPQRTSRTGLNSTGSIAYNEASRLERRRFTITHEI